jgi:hypothetical protein
VEDKAMEFLALRDSIFFAEAHSAKEIALVFDAKGQNPDVYQICAYDVWRRKCGELIWLSQVDYLKGIAYGMRGFDKTKASPIEQGEKLIRDGRWFPEKPEMIKMLLADRDKGSHFI